MREHEYSEVYRRDIGDAFEERLIAHLQNVGLRVVPFGLEHAIRPGAVRARIKGDNSPLRSLPDLLVTNGRQLIAIDAKASPPWMGPHWHNCAERSLSHLLEFERFSGYPAFLVFSDFMSISVQEMYLVAELVTHGHPLMERVKHNERGTGMPFYTINCTSCVRLDRTLGSVFHE